MTLINATSKTPTVAGPDADITIDAAGAAGNANLAAQSQHGHKASTTAGPGADITIDAAGAAGATGALARTGHGHKVSSTAGPDADIAKDAAGAAGTSGTLARSQHGHKLVTDSAAGDVVAIGKTINVGASGTVGRARHVHTLQGNALQTIKVSSGSIAAGASATVTITWTTTFGDTLYSVAVSCEFNGAITPPTHYVNTATKTATQVQITIKNNDASARTFTVLALGIHD